MNIVLTGMMATGKSSVGREVARLLEMEFIDTDEMIEKDTGRKISSIFKEDGEPVFRALEKKAVRIVSMLNNFVIATGGGAVKDPENMAELEKNSVVICLKAEPEAILERSSETGIRPLLDVEDQVGEINKIYLEREKLYKRCDGSVDTTGRRAENVALEISGIIEKLRENAH